MDLKNDILASMSDEQLIDIHLVGNDGVEVPCSKFILSARSEVFKTMFHSGFREQHDDRSNLAYPSKVIEIIVQYCYSDVVNLKLIPDDEGSTNHKIELLVQLRDAARYFALQRIHESVEKHIGELVFRSKAGVECVCLFMAEIMAHGEFDGPFWDMLFRFVVMKPVECLHLDQGVITCHPRLLVRVLEKVDSTFVVARCLHLWSIQESEGDTPSTDKDREALLTLAKRIDLKLLSPKQLSSIGHCLAFSKDRMLEAYAHHGRISEPFGSSRFSFPPKAIVNVTGAGVVDLNGLYEQYDLSGRVFVKDGIYGGLKSEFEIKWDSAESKWIISVLPKTKNSSPLHMYQTPKDPENAEEVGQKEIPFNHWICLEGAKPAPYVAMIEPSNQPQQLLSTFGKSISFSPQFLSAAPVVQRPRSHRRSRVR